MKEKIEIEMRLTPDKIYEQFLEGKLTKLEVLDLLISIMERSDQDEQRAKCVELFGLLEIHNQKIFRIVENSFISDESCIVRSHAARVLVERFPKRNNYLPLKWAIIHESSPLVLRCLLDSFESGEDPHYNLLASELRKRLIKRYAVVPEAVDLILNLEIFYIEYSKEYSFEVGNTWYKIIRLIKRHPNSPNLIPKIHYLRYGGKGLENLNHTDETLEFLKDLFPESNVLESLPNFWDRVKLESFKTS